MRERVRQHTIGIATLCLRIVTRGFIFERDPLRKTGAHFALALAFESGTNALKRDEMRMNHHRALGCCLSMIFSENRFTLFRIML
ncbi:hypothetical protein [Bradyrhizobium cenepequi]|uniref:hypothetical protein n=1 Tax=Bradyrhizobium cenepequi TaxID=2821403 RepID=UPI001CE2A6AC|nr:hypothetical protein [Bradyrhizobium cenepequi]MCA6111850.1 hypothetical protein [Bradyrhizobium cenepequi]